MDLHLSQSDGFLRVAAASPRIRVADVEGNAEVALAAVREAAERGVRALVLPELNLTGYTAADLFHNRTLLHACEAALVHILDETRELPIVFTVGLPVAVAENIYNCAAVCCAGELLGLTAKKYLPNYGEFYERRWFAPAPADPVWVEFAGQGPVPLGSGLVYRCCDEDAEDMVLGVEVCEDLWVPAPPSTEMALAGATVILNRRPRTRLSARQTIAAASSPIRVRACTVPMPMQMRARASPRPTWSLRARTSSTKTAPSSPRPNCLPAIWPSPTLTLTAWLPSAVARRRGHARTMHRRPRPLNFRLRACWQTSPSWRNACDIDRVFPRAPFVPADHGDLAERCETILDLGRPPGLKTRLAHTGTKAAVIGLSGGLDSTLALLVTVRAFDALGLPRTGITAVSMPGFGTTHRTKSNAESLARDLGVSFREVSIHAARGAALQGH